MVKAQRGNIGGHHSHFEVSAKGFFPLRAENSDSPCAFNSLRAEPEKITGVTMRMWSRLLIMPPMTGVASGFITSAPVRVLHMIGQQAGDDRGDGHHLRPQAQARAVLDRASQILQRKRLRPSFRRCFFQRFLEIDDHDHAGLDRGAEERDVADPDRDAEVVAEQVLQKDAAAQREGHGEDDVRRFLDGCDRRVEQQEDDEQHGRHDEHERALRAELVLVFAAAFDASCRRAGRLISCAMRLLHFLDEAAEVAVLHVGLHEDAQRPFSLAISLGPLRAPDLRDLAERDG